MIDDDIIREIGGFSDEDLEGVDINSAISAPQTSTTVPSSSSSSSTTNTTTTTAATSSTTPQQSFNIDRMSDDENSDDDDHDDLGTVPLDNDPNDPIVRRYEVFLTNNLANNLFLFQYPLRAKTRPYDFNQLTEVRFKKEHKKMEMEFELNTQSEHYDQDNPQSMSSFTLASKVVPLRTNYAVGVTRGNHLHITPLQNILQFKTSLEHLERDGGFAGIGEKVVNREDKEKGATASSASSSSTGKAQPQLVQTTYRSQADERARQKSYEYMKQQEQAEKDMTMEFYPSDHSTARQVFERLFATYDNPVSFDMSPAAYLETLVPYKHDVMARLKGEQISMDIIQKMPGAKQVQFALFAANILNFDRIKQMATNVKDDEQLISIIEDNADLVRGCWVLKSHLKQLNPNNPNQKFTMTVETACRDYLMYLFHKQPLVDRIAFTEKTKLDTEVAKEMLEEIALIKEDKSSSRRHGYWSLKLPPDEKFMAKYPEVVERQNEAWKMRTQQILNNVESSFKNIKPAVISAGAGVTRPQDINKAVVNFIRTQFQQHGVCTFAMLADAFRTSRANSEALSNVGNDHFKNVCQQITRSFCTDQYLILKQADLPEAEAPMRDAIIEILEERKDEKLTRQTISDEAKQRLPSDSKPPQLGTVMKILNELAVDTQDGFYVVRKPAIQ